MTRLRAQIVGSFPEPQPRRKLRRLLLAALDAGETETRALFDALHELSHQASYVFCHPSSPTSARLVAMHATLDEPSYRAVLAFLEWVADGPFSLAYRYRAIVALRGVWTRFGVDTQRVSAFYQPFTTYQRAPLRDAVEERLARRIETAFADTPYPAAITSGASDESCDVALLFHGMRWPWLTAEYLDLQSAALAFFEPEAFRYFLPAYLLGNVAGQASNANPVFHLTHGLDVDQSEAAARFVHFSSAERAAIVAFLQACSESQPGGDETITRALDAYWLPSLR